MPPKSEGKFLRCIIPGGDKKGSEPAFRLTILYKALDFP